ncbi:hypothetical protein PAXINDRAFT_16576 [Paxillus involutus ATCC 200175]|uniref:Uncharacterized protein n=1 Tax=Paxillus involutus ATCC 200175 TaxID=664439 RepID=A0A0C9TT72_PAXIN|nr:hypothetical protein PAXINDRAFT_16576 [Paxillus involutus ATCC 200175]
MIGMKVMVTQNVKTNLDIANRARGTIINVLLSPDEPTILEIKPITKLPHLPICILVKLTRTRATRLKDLEESLPGPLLLNSNTDSEEAARAILRVGTVGPPKQEGDASESSIPWTDTWWLPGGKALASDYGTRSLQAFAQLARECFDAGGTKLETLQSRNLPLLCLELMQMELAAAYQLTRQALCKVEAEILFNFKRVREMDQTWGSKALIEASTMPRLSASEQPTYVCH